MNIRDLDYFIKVYEYRSISVAAQLESDELQTVPFTEELKWPLYIITKKGRSRSKAVDRFISFIKENRID